jgi:hypothetical protein
MKNRDEELKESFDFISKNLDITFDKVPGRLREMWYCEPNLDDEEQSDFSWTVFMYIVVFSKKCQGLNEFTFSEERLSVLFGNWQAALAFAEIDAYTDIKIEPFKIFDVENLEKIMVRISTRNISR